MAEFEELRDRLAAGRRDREAARAAALAATEAVVGLQRRLDSARRTASPDDLAGLADLEQEQADAVAAAAAAQGRLTDALGTEAGLAEAIARFTDPVTAVERLDDRTPILLLPLRIETRFKQSPAGTPQLWVRAYPDTCLVDAFEDSLTATEVANGSAFWAAIWRAAGDEGRERAAWRELVAACGSGRAGWVVRTLLPKNPGDKPEPADDTLDLIVVATGPQPPAVAAFWAATWSAQGQPAATAQARADLDAALGAAAAALVVANPPVNLDDPPPAGSTAAGTTPRVSVLQLPDAAELGARTTTWSSAPRVDVLPDRLVLVGYAGAGDPQPSLVELGDPIPGSLQAGPDPNAAPADQLKPVGDDPDHPDTLQIPDALAWMFDFERALAVGLAFRVDLSPAQAADGFGRLVVLGVRLTETPSAGSATLRRLLEHHLHSRAGLELLRQGTPTNDTEQGGAAYSWRDDSDASFGPLFKQEPQYIRAADPQQRLDGQRFADALGIGDALGTRIPGAGLADRVEAQAMQTALWPATIGYLMDTLLAPVFSDEAVESTREFFTRQVSGRGPLPALRIGAQPYGIQPGVAFSRLAWFGDRVPTAQAAPAALVRLIRQVEADWRPLLGRVSRIGGDGPDTHQQLLDVVGLHPTSVEYYPLTADSLEHKAYELSFFGTGIVEQLVAMFPASEPVDLLRRLGYAGEEVPDVLTKIYRARQRALDGPIVDDLPLSETTPIRGYAGGRNYIEWLADAAADSVAAVQAEQGFDDGKRPAALLYLLLRHAVQLSFRQTAIGLLASAGAIEDVAVLRREPAFVHVDAAATARSESRYAELFATAPAVTGDATLTVGDYIARNVRALESSVLPEQLEALDRLAGLPTARLERLLAEHVDTASYRIDAWRTGLLGWALDLLRSRPGRGPMIAGPNVAIGAAAGAAAGGDGDGADGGPGGIYLGAYGWIEDLRPEGKTLAPVTLPPDLAADIDKHATVPLTKDPTSLGLVHAPSINHAATAAVLRNAHVAHEGQMSVNLTSRRVRTALAVLEGMRGGQSLGALLGYQLERHLHDNGPLTVRALVYPLRLEYPLVANQIQSTATTDGAAQESIAAMNVVDGRKLLQHVESSGADIYPFGNPRLPRRPAPEEDAVTAAVRHIRDVNDAVADLVLAEGVHQAVLGNYDRSAGTLDAFAKGAYPPETDVVRTPRTGTGLTLRTVLHLPASGPANPLPGLTMTPLASAEPAVNRWLAARLPIPASVGVGVLYGDRATGTDRVETITQEELGLHPADLLYRAGAKTDQALTDLDERIVERLHAVRPVRLDRPVVIQHTERISGLVTFFELEGLLRSLRRVVVGARPIRPADVDAAGRRPLGRPGRSLAAPGPAGRCAGRPAGHPRAHPDPAAGGSRRHDRDRRRGDRGVRWDGLGLCGVPDPGVGHGLRAGVALRDVRDGDRPAPCAGDGVGQAARAVRPGPARLCGPAGHRDRPGAAAAAADRRGPGQHPDQRGPGTAGTPGRARPQARALPGPPQRPPRRRDQPAGDAERAARGRARTGRRLGLRRRAARPDRPGRGGRPVPRGAVHPARPAGRRGGPPGRRGRCRAHGARRGSRGRSGEPRARRAASAPRCGSCCGRTDFAARCGRDRAGQRAGPLHLGRADQAPDRPGPGRFRARLPGRRLAARRRAGARAHAPPGEHRAAVGGAARRGRPGAHAAAAPAPGRPAVAGPGDPGDGRADRRAAALHGRARRRARPGPAAVRPARRRLDRGRAGPADHDRRGLPPRPAERRAAAGLAARAAGVLRRHMVLGGAARRGDRDARRRQTARARAGPPGHHAVRRPAAGHALGLDVTRDLDLEQPAAQRRPLRAARGRLT